MYKRRPVILLDQPLLQLQNLIGEFREIFFCKTVIRHPDSSNLFPTALPNLPFGYFPSGQWPFLPSPVESFQFLLLVGKIIDRKYILFEILYRTYPLHLIILKFHRHHPALFPVHKGYHTVLHHIEQSSNSSQRIKSVEFIVLEICSHLSALYLIEMH